MEKFSSIKKTSQQIEYKFPSGRTSPFTRLKTEYMRFEAQVAGTDFANAPTTCQKRYDMLLELKKLAENEKLTDEVRSIEKELSAVKEQLTSSKINNIVNAYYQPVNVVPKRKKKQERPDVQLASLLNSCRTKDGFLDPNAEILLTSLNAQGSEFSYISQVVDFCRLSDGTFDKEKMQPVITLSGVGVPVEKIPSYIESFTTYEPSLKKDCIDMISINHLAGLVSGGLSDTDAMSIMHYSSDFEETPFVEKKLTDLVGIGFNLDTSFNIVNSFVSSTPTGYKKSVDFDELSKFEDVISNKLIRSGISVPKIDSYLTECTKESSSSNKVIDIESFSTFTGFILNGVDENDAKIVVQYLSDVVEDKDEVKDIFQELFNTGRDLRTSINILNSFAEVDADTNKKHIDIDGVHQYMQMLADGISEDDVKVIMQYLSEDIDNKADAKIVLDKLLETGRDVDVSLGIIGSFTKIDEITSKKHVDTDAVYQYMQMLADGISEDDVKVIMQYLSEDIDNKDEVKIVLDKLLKTGRDVDASLSIIGSFTKIDEITSKKHVDTDAVYQYMQMLADDIPEDDVKFIMQYLSSYVENKADAKIILDKLLKAGYDVDASFGIMNLFTEDVKNSSKKNVNVDAVVEYMDFLSKGLSEEVALKLSKFLSANFVDKDLVKSSLFKLTGSGLDVDSSIKLMKTLLVKNQDGKFNVVPESVDTVLTFRKILASNRKNETAERKNPINQLGVKIFSVGDFSMHTKNGKIINVSSFFEDDYDTQKQRYDDLVESIENEMLLEFVKKYKSKDGSIDSKYIRVATFLRKAGMVYDGFFNAIDSCIKEDGSIDAKKLKTIKTFKDAGALAFDIPMLLDACSRNENGDYNPVDIQLISDLTSCIIGGNEVCSLLPVMKANDEIKDIIMLCAPYFDRNENLFEALSLMKKPDGKYGENEMEFFYDLAFSFFSEEDNYGKDDDFLKIAEEIMSLAKNEHGEISDDATGICAIMLNKNESISDVKEALIACFDENNKVDKNLAQVLWDMYVLGASFDEVKQVLDACKHEDGLINDDKINTFISMIETKSSKEEILNVFTK